MKKLIKWLSFKEWGYKLALKIISNRVLYSDKRLTPEYLEKRGWVKVNDKYKGELWVEPMTKDRDKIYISFENHWYRVWHSEDKTFITLTTSVEWFEIYYLMSHPHRGMYDLAPIV
jgi:hypothetical protein